MLYLTNGFSPGMIGGKGERWGNVARFEFRTLRPRAAGNLLRENRFISCFGHADTAWHLSRYLKVEIPVCRESIVPGPDDMILVASAKHVRTYHKGFLGTPRWCFYLVRRISK